VLPHELGRRQGQTEIEAPPAKAVGKNEIALVGVVVKLTAAGTVPTEQTVNVATVATLQVPVGTRDRRREFAWRAFLGPVGCGVLVVADDGAVTARLARDAAPETV
jgi:hypothetical protein